jgi:hypothetical protein
VGLEATQEMGKMAAAEAVDFALAGGLAMYLYGSPRLTKDVDVIAVSNAPFSQKNKRLKRGNYERSSYCFRRADGGGESAQGRVKEHAAR